MGADNAGLSDRTFLSCILRRLQYPARRRSPLLSSRFLWSENHWISRILPLLHLLYWSSIWLLSSVAAFPVSPENLLHIFPLPVQRFPHRDLCYTHFRWFRQPLHDGSQSVWSRRPAQFRRHGFSLLSSVSSPCLKHIDFPYILLTR